MFQELFSLLRPDFAAGQLQFVSLHNKIYQIQTMIQRIQSVFLLLAALSAVLLFFYPVAEYFDGINYAITFHIHHLQDHVPGNEQIFPSAFLLPLIILNALTGILALLTLFMYKQMVVQLRLARIALFLNVLLIGGLFFFYTGQIAKMVMIDPQYKFGIYLPVITLLFLVLAMRSIQKDIKLVRSADRLR